ncbi:MAG: glycosyltransferase family 39 protein [Cyanobacteria bacterium P01_A01_bin.114]
MPTHPKSRLSWTKNSILIACIFLVTLGVGFRFGNLNQVYWHDEIYTSLRMSGYDTVHINATLFDGRLITVDDLMYYQWPTPERTLADTLQSLAIEDSQHPPLYYILVRQWVALFGNTIWLARSLSALVSLLIFPAIYWLYQELFLFSDTPKRVTLLQRRLTSYVAIMLVAVSPFHILYAQEAREYVLWTVLSLVVSALLLRALRRGSFLDWALYACLLATSLNTHPFTVFVVLGHGVYVLVVEKFRPTRQFLSYLLSVAGGFLLFVPWLFVIISKAGTAGASWTAQPIPWLVLLKVWGLNLARCFILTEGDFGFDTWQVYLTLPLALLLVGYAIYFMGRHTPFRFWLFILLLMASTFLPLAMMDLILGGQRSTPARYLIPSVLGVQMAIATLLSMQLSIQANQANWLKRQFWIGATTVVLMLGITSGFKILKTESSWIKVLNYNLPSVARVVDASPKPLVISSSEGINFGSIFALSHRLDPKVRFLLLDSQQMPDSLDSPQIPPGFEDVFLFNPSEKISPKD